MVAVENARGKRLRTILIDSNRSNTLEQYWFVNSIAFEIWICCRRLNRFVVKPVELLKIKNEYERAEPLSYVEDYSCPGESE